MNSLEEAIKELYVWQHGNSNSFYTSLISIYHSKADQRNKEILNKAYPFLRMAYVLWINATDNGDDLFRAYDLMPISGNEILESMTGHVGTCKHCGKDMVKMSRNQTTMELTPDFCVCLSCGARYQMLIDDIEKWEAEQWDQKINNQ